jgi:hypothetical protein
MIEHGCPKRLRTQRRASASAWLCLSLLAGCPGPQAHRPESTPPPAPVTPVEPAKPAVDPTIQACAPHILPTPGPDYPTWTTSCQMPALPAGYPLPRPQAERPWQQGKRAATGPLKVSDPKNIEKLLNDLKAYVAPAFNAYLLDPTSAAKRPDNFGWRMMPWLGDSDCNADWSGRDASAGTSTGQLIPAGTLPGQNPTAQVGDLQNHSITWYDPWGSFALSSVFGAGTPGVGDPTKEQMVDGTVIVKIGALTPYADGSIWPPVKDAPTWPVYRPPVGQNTDVCTQPPGKFGLLQTRVLQFDIIVKSSYYAPETQWVFATWIYDPSAKGKTPLDHFTILGAMWGNDPGIAQKDLCTPVSPLQQNWISPKAPAYGYQQLGWGCRLSGPIDIARRPVEFADGSSCKTARVSACMSCHGSSELVAPSMQLVPATLYPLVTSSYSPFKLANPGSDQWWNWFQSRAPTMPQGDQNGLNKDGYIAFDYDMIFILSVPISRASAGTPALMAHARNVGHGLHEARRSSALVNLTVPPSDSPSAAAPPAGCDCSCVPNKKRL